MYHILVVDDDKAQAQNVAATLHTFGYRTTSAHNHDEALLALDRHGPFDLVLLDLILGDPVLDGLAVCQKIRARPDPPPIIMLTVLSLETDMHKGLELGASDYITDRKSTRLNSSHGYISYAVFCLKKKKISI